MTALTPGCDPDMSTTGAPFGATSGGGPGLLSGLVLVAVVAVSTVLATGDSVPGAVAFPAVVVWLLCGLALLRRGIRVAHRAGSAATASVARAVHRSRPVPTAAP